MAFGRRVGCATLSWTLMSLVAKLNEPECYGNSIFFPYLLWDDDNCLMQQLRSFWVMEKSRIVPNTKPAFQLMAWELLQSWNNEWNWKIVIFKIPYTIPAWWLTTAEWRLQMLKKNFFRQGPVWKLQSHYEKVCGKNNPATNKRASFWE